MGLTHEFVLHSDVAKAAGEALVNIDRLRLAGRFRDAFEVCAALVRPGPWACPQTGSNYRRAASMLPTLAWLNGAMCPSTADRPAQTPVQLRRWAARQQQESFAHLVIADRLQLEPAGAGWTREMLDALPAMRDGEQATPELCRFLSDLDWVLNDRVRRVLRIRPHELVPSFVRMMTPFRSAATIRIAPGTEQFEHGYLLDALCRCVRDTHGGGGHLGGRCLLLSVVLDLAAGDARAAGKRLVQWSSVLIDRVAIDHAVQLWKPYVELLGAGVLAEALGIDDAQVDEYMQRFRARTTAALRPAPDPIDFDWHGVLAAHCAQLQIELSDPERSDNAIGMLDHQAPRSSGLIEVARRGDFMPAALTEAEVAALEARLGVRLPPSYRNFLRTSNGLFAGGGLSLLPAADVDWFSNLDPESIEIWNTDGDEASDEQYANYGPDQDCIHMRPRHLRTALQVSTAIDGDVLLLIPEVRFGDEWEAWFFGAKNPGAYRYRSFAEMIEQTVLKWERW